MDWLLSHFKRTPSRSSSFRQSSSNTSTSDNNKHGGHQMSNMQHYKVAVMGASAVGKTCIVNRFLHDRFITDYDSTLEDMHRGEYEVDGMWLTLDILDTTGAYPFAVMRNLAINSAHAFVLVYNISDKASFDVVRDLRLQIIKQKKQEQFPIVVVGNKIDMAINSESGSRIRTEFQKIAECTALVDWNLGYVETSAKEDINIVKVFKELLAQLGVPYALSPAVRRRRESKYFASRKHGKSKGS